MNNDDKLAWLKKHGSFTFASDLYGTMTDSSVAWYPHHQESITPYYQYNSKGKSSISKIFNDVKQQLWRACHGH